MYATLESSRTIDKFGSRLQWCWIFIYHLLVLAAATNVLKAVSITNE